MNRNNEIIVTHSKTKAQWWRMRLIMGLIFSIGVINSGCDKSEENSDEYYVKYTVRGQTGYIGLELSVTINTEDNVETLTVPTSGLARTIGPVQKRFEASLEARCTNEDREGAVTLNGGISVSKNNYPFVEKAQVADIKGPIGISYTIDF